MKYHFKKNNVIVQKDPTDGTFDVTLFGSKTVKLTQEELSAYLTLKDETIPVSEEVKNLARKIVDTELMVDEGNAEYLLNEATGYAKKIIKLL